MQDDSQKYICTCFVHKHLCLLTKYNKLSFFSEDWDSSLHFLVFSKGEIAIILKCVSWPVDIAHVNSSKKKNQNSNEWKLVEELPAAGFIIDRS